LRKLSRQTKTKHKKDDLAIYLSDESIGNKRGLWVSKQRQKKTWL
jgi:hypothetical protein